jgi:hypothetical protein
MSSNIQIHDIVITPQLSERGYRNCNADLEKQAFQKLAKQSSYGTQAILDALCDLTLSLCNADSSGVSLLQVVDGEDGFTWNAMAGSMASYVGGRAPRHHSPCGYCLERDAAQLYSYPERFFEWMRPVGKPIVEGMVIPLYGKDKNAIGTIWMISHRGEHQFDRYDLQIMSIFANHASAALRMQELY